MVVNIRRFLSGYINPAAESVLNGVTPVRFRWIEVLWLLGLYVGGIIVLGHFFNWGNFDMLYHDWAQVTGPRLQFLQTAIREGILPLHISDSETFHLATTRFFSVADVSISPQYLLLKWLSLPVFSLVDVCFLYSLGFIGLLLLKRKLKLSPIAFTILFLLFNFNGYIFAHYNVGHASFGGYFLYPWFIWLVLRLLDGDHSWWWTTLMAVVLFFIWLQGSYHQFVWLLILLALIGILVPRTFLTIVRTGVATFFVSAFRILPCILSYPSYSMAFLNGYPSLLSIWDSLVNLPGAGHPTFFVDSALGYGVGTWETACFIGLLGGMFLVYFGIYRGLMHVKAAYNTLLVPIGVMILLTIGPVFEVFRLLPIPLIQGERVSSRIISVPLVFGLALAAQQFQNWIDGISKKMLVLGGSVVGLLICGVELWQDFLIWRISNRDQNFWIYFNPAKWFPKNNMGDTVYIWLVFGGLAISVLAIAALSIISWREFRKNKLAEPQSSSFSA